LLLRIFNLTNPDYRGMKNALWTNPDWNCGVRFGLGANGWCGLGRIAIIARTVASRRWAASSSL
jgi:hypothetical protein